MDIKYQSILTCPVCGHAETLRMPSDACMFFMNALSVKPCLGPKKEIVVFFVPTEIYHAHPFSKIYAVETIQFMGFYNFDFMKH
jgi:hypothetical protein